MSEGSRIPGFYKLGLAERRAVISRRAHIELAELEHALEAGGLDTATADKVVENVLGIYGLPFGVALNVRVNGVDRLVPMVVEEPSVIAAASNAARMIRQSGGFRAEVVESLMIGQVQITNVEHPAEAVARLEAAAARLLALATKAVPNLVARGGGPRAIDVRDLGQRCIVLHVLVDCRDAMGANLVNTIAEALGPITAEIAGGKLGLRILSNLCDRRRVHATCRVHARELVSSPRSAKSADPTSAADDMGELDGLEVVDAIVSASRFAELDPYRAATHNKGIMNGIDAVVLATGNDFRAVEAGIHAYASKSGQYSSLSHAKIENDTFYFWIEIPLALGTVGGLTSLHPLVKMALEMLEKPSAKELMQIVAVAGLAQNFAALRSLTTTGIQEGHMKMHLNNIINQFQATDDERSQVKKHFKTHAVSHAAVVNFITDLRK